MKNKFKRMIARILIFAMLISISSTLSGCSKREYNIIFNNAWRTSQVVTEVQTYVSREIGKLNELGSRGLISPQLLSQGRSMLTAYSGKFSLFTQMMVMSGDGSFSWDLDTSYDGGKWTYEIDDDGNIIGRDHTEREESHMGGEIIYGGDEPETADSKSAELIDFLLATTGFRDATPTKSNHAANKYHNNCVGDLKKKDQEKAAENVQKATFDGPRLLDMFSGFCMRCMMSQTSYNVNLLTDSKPNFQSFTPLDPFEKSTFPDDLVKAINQLSQIQVHWLDPNTDGVAGVGSSLDQIQRLLKVATPSPDDPNLQALLKLFKTDQRTYGLEGIDELKKDDIYGRRDPISLARYVSEHNSDWELHVYGFNFSKLYKILEQTGEVQELLSRGVLIGGHLFITKYPVAVFQGMRETDIPGEYVPIFWHPDLMSPDWYPAAGSGVNKPKFTNFTQAGFQYDEFLSEDGAWNLDNYTPLMYDLATGAILCYEWVMEDVNGVSTPRFRQVNSSSTAYTDFLSNGANGLQPSLMAFPNFNRLNADEPFLTPYTGPNTVAVWLEDSSFGGFANASDGGAPVVTYTSAQFVLMDYLELTYSPGLIGDESLVAYGRKVRLDETKMLSSGTLTVNPDTPVAFIIGGEQDRTAEVWTRRDKDLLRNRVLLSELADVNGFFQNGISKTGDGSTNASDADLTTVPTSIRLNTGNNTSGHVINGDPSSIRGDRLPQIVARRGIECVVPFGSTMIAEMDMNTSPQTPLYGIALYGGLYDRGLFPSWINVDANKNLKDWEELCIVLGYPNYKIDGAVLSALMRGNYAFELNNDGLLALDLDVIVDINRMNEQARENYAVVFLRTLLLTLGFIFLAYVSLLLAAWAVDVNLT